MDSKFIIVMASFSYDCAYELMIVDLNRVCLVDGIDESCVRLNFEGDGNNYVWARINSSKLMDVLNADDWSADEVSNGQT